MKKTFFAALLALIISGCQSDGKDNKIILDSVGKPYEIFVFADPETFKGEAGDSLRVSLEEEVYMINEPERSLQLKNMPFASFKGLTRKHRNMIIFQVGEKYPNTKVFTVRNKYAKPQLITVFEAPNVTALRDLITLKRDSIKTMYEKEELNRYAVNAAKVVEPKSVAKVKSMFDMSLSLPKGYVYRNSVDDNFLWISYELPESSQGVIIYEYPYDGEEISTEKIIKARNKFVKLVPGELPKSYMTTSDMIDPETQMKMINGKEWFETRGFWRVENDFMGGPFVSYTTVDEKRNRVLVADWYVFSPNPHKGQREFIRQLEGIMQTAKIL